MSPLLQSTVLGTVGMLAAAAAANGLYLNFVKESLRWPLLAAGALLVALAAYGALVDRPAAEEGGAGHGHPLRIGWLFALPFLLLGIVAPPPLGAYSAERDSGVLPRVESAEGLPPLPSWPDPLPLSLSEFSARALYDDRRPLAGRTVRLTGFVSRGQGREGWVLTRMALSCCAADGLAVKVAVRGGERLPDDTWLEVEGQWVPTPAAAPGQTPGLPVLQISAQREIDRPAQPYE